jgi:hypothetical protein
VQLARRRPAARYPASSTSAASSCWSSTPTRRHKTVTSFQTNKEHDASYGGSQPNILATDADTGFFVFGDITIDPGLRLVLQGMLKLGSAVEISGRFEFSIGPNPCSIESRPRPR